MKFTIIDIKTGEYPDVEKIAIKEEWAKGLVYCDIDSFAITEDGTLILLDDCGNMAYCPADRFKIIFDNEQPQSILTARCEMDCSFCPFNKGIISVFLCPCGETQCRRCSVDTITSTNFNQQSIICPHCNKDFKIEVKENE